MSSGFLGRGWSFPPTFDRSLARVEMLEEEADIASSLEVLLSTIAGERVMLPQYGCNLEELVFENLDTRMKTMMADNIESAILYHEPRIRLERVRLDASREMQGVVLIEVMYRVKTTNSRFNFVYPYYRLEGTDIDLAATINLLPDKGRK
ncbi:MAG: GPW/gp25 family protein [Deltaproteobacteria bacterium]|nr:GPW/gp25 family protein [Deltaproteobacteria bacterium]MBZ0219719.1 GPW/gp25 family protein [Deltaproteobacteria bacterium]